MMEWKRLTTEMVTKLKHETLSQKTLGELNLCVT